MLYPMHVLLESRLDEIEELGARSGCQYSPSSEFTVACDCTKDSDPAKQRRSLKAICWNGSVRGGMEENVFTITSVDKKKSLTELLHEALY